MRPTPILLGRHAGRMFRFHWKVQGKRRVFDNGALKTLRSSGIEFVDANQFVNKRVERKRMELNPPPPPTYSYSAYTDSNVLLGGLAQAQVFTNSVQLPPESLPIFDQIQTEPQPLQDKLVKRCVRSSLLYDAYQETLPKRKDPEREAWNFPRDYGITDKRRNRLLGNRLLQLCSSLSPQMLAHRRTVSNAKFSVSVDREGKPVILDQTIENLITSNEGIEPPVKMLDVENQTKNASLPDIHPMVSTISLATISRFQAQPEDQFHINGNSEKAVIHTGYFHYNPTEVQNLYETEVREDQFLGRSLMKAFTLAVAQARLNYGPDIEDLPQPVTVQCVHTNSQSFHFSVLQLNTVKEHKTTNLRNIYWSLPPLTLFKTCDYVDAKPVLDGYNPDVFNVLLKFYYNR